MKWDFKKEKQNKTGYNQSLNKLLSKRKRHIMFWETTHLNQFLVLAGWFSPPFHLKKGGLMWWSHGNDASQLSPWIIISPLPLLFYVVKFRLVWHSALLLFHKWLSDRMSVCDTGWVSRNKDVVSGCLTWTVFGINPIHFFLWSGWVGWLYSHSR